MDAEESRAVDEAKITEKELHFFYNREARLAKASPRVRALYEGAPRKRFGFFSVLTDSRGKAVLLGAIIVICLVMLFITYLVPENRASIGGNVVTVQAMRFNGVSFIVLKKAAKKDAYTGIVRVTVSDANERGGSFDHSVVFTGAESEEARWSAPLVCEELLIFLQAGADVGSFRVRAD
jgi:hypothetical protein